MQDNHNPLKRIREKIFTFSKDHHLFPDVGKLAVAVSGGADSIALLHLLRQIWLLRNPKERELHVFHFDHRFQIVSRHHARFVADLCKILKLPFHLGRWTQDLSLGQEKARQARYRFFREQANQLGVEILALAHNASDQAETILWRILRGSSPGALAGMVPKRVVKGLTLIRPLLSLQRQEIEQFLLSMDQGYCQDPSNMKTTYLRNRIRLQLLPELSRYSPQIQEHLIQLGASLARESAYMEDALDTWMKRHGLEKGSKTLAFSRHLLCTCPKGLRFRLYMRLFHGLPDFPAIELKLYHLQALEKLVEQDEPQKLALPGGWSVKTTSKADGSWVRFQPVALHNP